MSLFSNYENAEPESRGILGRLKGWRSSFREPGASSVDSMPIAGGHVPVPDDEPRFKTTSKPVKPVHPQHVTLGMRLRDGDITDVDAWDAGNHEVAPVSASASASVPAPVPADAYEDERADDRQNTDQDGATAIRESSAVGDRAAVDVGTTSHTAPTASVDPTGDDEPSEHRSTVAEELVTELAAHDVEVIPAGLPQLVSAESLTFKRILCERGPDAALRITDAARRRFVAVDLQAGVAIVVATREFREMALYSTYLKDLARADIAVREEMVASEEVIAAIYGTDRNRSTAVIPEASRAIGMFRDVIEAAHGYGASDGHYEYRDFNDEVEIRFRVHGDLYTYRHMPKALVRRALSASYQDLVQRNTNSAETFQPNAPQSAMIPLVVQTDVVNLRWQSSPLVGGFDVGLRLLDGNFRHYKVLMPEQMGLETSQLKIIRALGNVSGGVTILSGETGSAKSTLLRALSYMMTSRDLRKQYAVSQPAEFPNPWLSEISIPHRPDESEEDASRKAAEVIRTLMRMDPDDLTVTEIRDAVMAALVTELALTGHPVRTTLHADSAIGVFMRLAGGRLQLPMDEVSSEKFVNAVGNQKLIPLLCPHCKVPARDVMSQSDLRLLETKFGLDTSAMACRDEEGCEHCRLKGLVTRAGKVAGGTKGQTLAMELFRPSPEFLDRIAVRDWRGAEKVWRATRATGFNDADMTGKTIYEHALYKASTGIIDPRFINDSMRPFDEYRIFADRDGRMPS
ncbi:ATPase, T2SS/T4P/T4SS family [Paraburkholderia sp. RL17-373-BIF-A]|uniref:ATPase, T2SS/T4P/T4SS family n=1 Tax=Paraburkholderia sp. RL17-373-BIF-A TaxID=3031629 RepID=UPI0038BD106A